MIRRLRAFVWDLRALWHSGPHGPYPGNPYRDPSVGPTDVGKVVELHGGDLSPEAIHDQVIDARLRDIVDGND